MPQTGGRTEQRIPAEEEKPTQPPFQPQPSGAGDLVEKAKRLARTILSDIYLYSKAKVDEAIRKDAFHTTFASELKEGLKLYENRVLGGSQKNG